MTFHREIMWERSGTINLNWQWYLYLLYCFLYYLIHWILHPCTHTNLKLKNPRIALSIFYPFSTYLYIPIYLSLAIFNPKFFFLLFPHLFLLIRLPLVVLLLLLHFSSSPFILPLFLNFSLYSTRQSEMLQRQVEEAHGRLDESSKVILSNQEVRSD